jgi:hypothetical protein
MRAKARFLVSISIFVAALHANAAYVSLPANNEYTISLDNGVVYINHSGIIAPCQYGRVEIRSDVPYSAEYAKRMTAAIYMAKATGKNVAFTWNDATAPTCILNSVSIAN